MNQIMIFICLVALSSCAHQRGPASVGGNPVAYDSMALGNVKASAVKRFSNQEVCFDIDLVTKDVDQNQAQASNWTLAWIDKNNQYHHRAKVKRSRDTVPLNLPVAFT